MRLTMILLSALSLTACNNAVRFSPIEKMQSSLGAPENPVVTPELPPSAEPPIVTEPPVVVEPPVVIPPVVVEPPVVVPPVVEPPVVVDPPTTPSSQAVSESFQAPPASDKVDILVILDTTESMDTKLDKLAARFRDLTKHLSNLDFQVAVTNAGATRSSFWIHGHRFGKIMEFQSDSARRSILSSKDEYVDYYFQLTVGRDNFRAGEIRCEVQPYCMVPSPEPLAALVRSFNERQGANKGFFRQDAWLVPLIISDADENENGADLQFSVDSVIARFQQTLGSTMRGMAGVGIIVQPGDEQCLRAENSGLMKGGHYGHVLSDFARRTKGLTMSICDQDYGPGLERISDHIRELMTSVELKHEPLAGTLRVNISPADGVTWKLEGRKVVFSKPLPANARVDVSYRIGL
ncbi:MAG: hypothetical protein KF802_07035 [Bdellovibrionaceae bacterium]|nr:hypothetical protein [Pseudobdellovibrionaceae bacterium]